MKLPNSDAEVLLVEDTVSLAVAFSTHLENEGISVDMAHLGLEARDKLSNHNYALVLLDLQLPDIDGLTLLAEITERGGDTQVIVVTSDASAERVVKAMRMGAHDYLVKPVEPPRLILTVRNVLQLVQLRRQIKEEEPRTVFFGFVGSCKPMQAVYSAIENVSQSKATVFITGESGTGKEVCADAIHRCGPRADKPFVALNCGAIPSELIESEIFGHVKGAFTGAIGNRDGAATLANGGTLFLDEICEMDVTLQTKLLRFLQTSMIQRVGGQKLEKVDIRVICATNRDPLEEVASGRFREDLYYRLNVIPLRLPPLRERGSDLLLIAGEFLKQFSREEGKSFTEFEPEAADKLMNYGWPGNVRELQNMVRRVVVMNDALTVNVDMLPDSLNHQGVSSLPSSSFESFSQSGAVASHPPQQDDPTTGQWIPGDLPLAEIERLVIESRIQECEGNVSEAAALLGVSPSTLYRKKESWKKSREE